jgi:hypothetical protein
LNSTNSNDEIIDPTQPRKRKKKSENTRYFTEDTEEAITQYLTSTDEHFRNKVFKDRIYYPFYKLSENLIHTFKFYYTEVDNLEDLKHEVMTFLLEKLHYFQVGKGKAFSYFSIVGKNYLILYNNSIYKKKKNSAELDEVDEDPETLNVLDRQDMLENTLEFLDLYILWMDYNLSKIFPKKEDEQIADAVLEIFKKRDNIEIFNKKALYIFIKEITDAQTPHITKVVKIMKDYYIRLFSEFDRNGYLKF